MSLNNLSITTENNNTRLQYVLNEHRKGIVIRNTDIKTVEAIALFIEQCIKDGVSLNIEKSNEFEPFNVNIL